MKDYIVVGLVFALGCASRPASPPSIVNPAIPAVARWLKTGAGGGPRTGDVFREIVMKAPHPRGYEIIAGSQNTKASDPLFKGLKFKSPKLDLNGVTKVEIRMELWSGHPDTNLRQIAFNGNRRINLADNPLPTPQAAKPAGAVGDYMAFIYSNTEIPLQHLKEGINDFDFEYEGGEIELFDWWSLTFRLYYDKATPAPQARIQHPAPGSALGDDSRFEIAATSPNGRITRVEYIGSYDDFNTAADGSHEGWQFRTFQGETLDHVGTALSPPWAITWDTRWIPDQEKPMKFIARVTDVAGYTTLTPVVDGVVLATRNRSVKLYRATDIPQRYTAFATAPKSNGLAPLVENLGMARAAIARVVTYNGHAASGLFMNEVRIAEKLSLKPYVYEVASIEIPIKALRNGDNRVRFESIQNPSQHGVDVMYPGAELKVAYDR